MAKRHVDALTIQLGACNPSGIAHSIVEACREIRAEPGHTGTAQICDDPAIRLMVHQLAFITGQDRMIFNYDQCMEACKENNHG